MARSRRPWGSVRSLASGRYQARYLDPDTRRMTPAPADLHNQTPGNLRWVANQRCFALQWSDVDLERKTLAVRRALPTSMGV